MTPIPSTRAGALPTDDLRWLLVALIALILLPPPVIFSLFLIVLSVCVHAYYNPGPLYRPTTPHPANQRVPPLDISFSRRCGAASEGVALRPDVSSSRLKSPRPAWTIKVTSSGQAKAVTTVKGDLRSTDRWVTPPSTCLRALRARVVDLAAQLLPARARLSLGIEV